jgi:hypothetical protein
MVTSQALLTCGTLQKLKPYVCTYGLERHAPNCHMKQDKVRHIIASSIVSLLASAFVYTLGMIETNSHPRLGLGRPSTLRQPRRRPPARRGTPAWFRRAP